MLEGDTIADGWLVDWTDMCDVDVVKGLFADGWLVDSMDMWDVAVVKGDKPSDDDVKHV